MLHRLGVQDVKRYEFGLVCGDSKVEDVGIYIRDLPSFRLNLIRTKVVLLRELEPEIPGNDKYWAAGVASSTGLSSGSPVLPLIDPEPCTPNQCC